MPKSVPLRMCAGCHQHKPKKELVRIVRSPEGEISLDLTGRKPGRGAYICADVSCLKSAAKQHSLERALEVEIPAEVFQQLILQLEEGNNE